MTLAEFHENFKGQDSNFVLRYGIFHEVSQIKSRGFPLCLSLQPTIFRGADFRKGAVNLFSVTKETENQPGLHISRAAPP